MLDTLDSPQEENQKSQPKNSSGSQVLGSDTAVPPGFGHGAVFLAETAMQCVIVALYNNATMPDYPRPSNILLTERNQVIIQAYRRGETLERIAATFEISIARVHQILKHRN